MKGRIAAWAMAVLLALYLVLVADRSVRLVATGEPVAVGLGVALVILPLIAAWALLRELLFGIRTERLVKDLEAEQGLPEDELPKRPSGRPDRAAADAEFERFRAEVDASPESWRAWFRLGLAYDASGDRRRARAALRRAIELNRQAA
ncbi:tetratricopeptide repeat protein [Agreia sp.]|uniref:tetratricopeptide repeat protein n=1 Tax=Agreia sp. TaxID=1872416 RepID=UPI0035BC7899